ncbi:hypothetical protein DM01DRAFT_173790 [Hesseltinella vesiculosa]|uniref:Uncharacterized protein n=1 Tax=Hesseltinella vesiculosa TaxID=101127 RepID=A0A1X2G9U9_9FUNG|nr:hypothetical protein DM01DRAFT_173790 [Hesseltinella vesiculosa]
MTRLLTPKSKNQTLDQRRLRPNYSSPDRFQQLRQLAESSSSSSPPAGSSLSRLPAQTKQNVLSEEEPDLQKQRNHRRKDIAILAQRSAVKNNPFVKQADSAQAISSVTPKSSVSYDDTIDANDATTQETDPADGTRKPKRNSKVINSLQTKSYVSSSIFKQQAPSTSAAPTPTATLSSNVPSSPELPSSPPTPSASTSATSSCYHESDSLEASSPVYNSKPGALPLDDSLYEPQVHHEHLQVDAPLQDEISTSAHTADIHMPSQHEDTVRSVPSTLDPHEEATLCEPAAADEPAQPSCQSDAGRSLEEEQMPASTLVGSLSIDTTKDVSTSSPPTPVHTTQASPITPSQAPSILYQDVDPVMSRPAVRNNYPSGHRAFSSGPPPSRTISATTKELRRRSGAQKDQWALELSSWASTLDRDFSLTEQNESPPSSILEPDDDHNTPVPSVHKLQIDDDTFQPTYAHSPSHAYPPAVNETLSHQRKPDQSPPALSRRGSPPQPLPTSYHHPKPHHQHECSNDTSGAQRHQDIGSVNEQVPLPQKSYGSVSVRSTSRYTRRLPSFDEVSDSASSTSTPTFSTAPSNTASNIHQHHQQQHQQQPRQHQHQHQQHQRVSPIQKKPSQSEMSWSSLLPPGFQKLAGTASPSRSPSISSQSSAKSHTNGHGKLYVRVNGVHDVLVPMPKERTQVRCVISDGKYEYMSRYESLAPEISFDYECIIDISKPDTIVNLSLHVRPDYVMRKPLTRLFSTSRKRKGSLSSYVSHEDGAIGQTRFAVSDMLRACYKHSYLASFHCFNAWHTKSPSSHSPKSAEPVDDGSDAGVLKVIANFDVELLYLPVTDPSAVSYSLFI